MALVNKSKEAWDIPLREAPPDCLLEPALKHHVANGFRMKTKEVLAGYMTLIWAHDILGTTEWTEYRLAVDSTSAGAALGRCYSSNPKINEMFVNMWAFMKKKKTKLHISTWA